MNGNLQEFDARRTRDDGKKMNGCWNRSPLPDHFEVRGVKVVGGRVGKWITNSLNPSRWGWLQRAFLRPFVVRWPNVMSRDCEYSKRNQVERRVDDRCADCRWDVNCGPQQQHGQQREG